MSSSSSTRNTIIDTHFTQQNWVAKLTQTLNHDLENDNEVPICIYEVPDSLRASKPEAYTPQLIALGPYHHLDSELYEMQRYKIVSAKMASKQFKLVEFKQITDHLMTFAQKIRHSYRGRLKLWDDAMVLIFTVDGLFLLHLLDNYVNQNDIPHFSSLYSSLLAHSSCGKKLPGDAIIRDVLMLENQIPRFVLIEILRKATLESTSPDDFLSTLFLKFCEILSPIKINWSFSGSEVLEHEHLLDLLYQYITYKKGYVEKPQSSAQTDLRKSDSFDIEANIGTSTNSNVISKAWRKISSLNIGFLEIIAKFLDLFLNILDHLGISASGFFHDKKVLIPSVSELWLAQVKFAPAKGGTRYVEFEEKSHTLYLPVVTLKPTSDVLIRNLVAYETMEKSDSLNFKRFIELMGAIVDTVEDVEILRNSKVLESEMSNAEIAEMFNGVTRTLESKDCIVDTAIKKANAYYNNTQKVRTKKLLKKYVYSSWRILTVLASVLLLLLMGLQTFCDIYSCSSMLGNVAASTSSN